MSTPGWPPQNPGPPYQGPHFPGQQLPGQQPPRRGTWPSLLGAAAGMVFTLVCVVVAVLVPQALTAIAGGDPAEPWPRVFGLIGTAILGLPVLVPLVMLAFSRLRLFAAGMLIGVALLLIIAAGACVVLFAAVIGSYG